MKKFTDAEKTELTLAAQTQAASPLLDAFWEEVEAELIRMNGAELTVEPKTRT